VKFAVTAVYTVHVKSALRNYSLTDAAVPVVSSDHISCAPSFMTIWHMVELFKAQLFERVFFVSARI